MTRNECGAFGGAPGGLGFVACFAQLVIHAIIHFFITVLMCFHVAVFPSASKPGPLDVSQSLYHNPCRSLELKCDFDEQASDSLQLSILESLLRSVCKKPKQRASGARHRECYSMSVFTALDTEEKLH